VQPTEASLDTTLTKWRAGTHCSGFRFQSDRSLQMVSHASSLLFFLLCCDAELDYKDRNL
jgi:hypothetical protein